MKKDLTLVIMAAGMGSRWGGLKQMEPFGPKGEFLIDYSIYDAMKAGFTKVVFIIKDAIYEDFKETVGKRIEDKIEVEYAFQELNDLPEGFTIHPERVKPWGTAHAIICAKDKVKTDFIVINADDFYGREAYVDAVNFLNNKPNTFGIIGYDIENTLTEHGTANRGICKVDGNYLTDIIESKVERCADGVIRAYPLDGSETIIVEEGTRTSMNMLTFSVNDFSYIEENFITFLEKNKDELKGEYLIPEVLKKSAFTGHKKVEVVPTTAKWMGVTYKEDKPGVIKRLNELIDNGVYPKDLWAKE